MRTWIRKGMLLSGIILCAYPMFARSVQERRQDKIISTYENEIKMCDRKELEKMMEDAREYNVQLFELKNLVMQDEEKLLSFQSGGVIGKVYIPKIDANIPIYHGTKDEVLAVGVGHLERTSLPIGGVNTHCVLTGHRGLPNAKLFTRLDELKVGDLFFIESCGQTMSYEVRKVQVIRPDNMDVFSIEEGNDLVSLVTCTPYGINTHRLVVTGERIDDIEKQKHFEESQPISLRGVLFKILLFVMLEILSLGCVLKWRKRRIG